MNSIGELIALGTVLCWTATALAFEAASRRVGSIPVNILRISLAAIFISLFCWFYRGHFFPTDATQFSWFWLALSGIAGFTIGDLCFFRSLVLLGSRLATLIMLTIAPPLAMILGYLALNEGLKAIHIIGMLLTIAGVVWVVMQRKSGDGTKVSSAGIALAVLGAVGQAGGVVLGKIGMEQIDAVGAAQLRILAGAGGFLLLATVLGWWPRVSAAFRDRRALGQLSFGAFFGPFLGVLLFQIAISYANVGVVQTIAALVPVVIIPFSVILYKEKVTTAAVLGSVVAVGGVALLFLA